MGVTGSGKTYTMAERHRPVTARPPSSWPRTRRSPRRPTPRCASSSPRTPSEYFVSYYDFYQPEAYVPARDPLHREGRRGERAHREQMRLAATKSIPERRDTIIVATVSAIYGISAPEATPRCAVSCAGATAARSASSSASWSRCSTSAPTWDFVRGTFPRRGGHDRRLSGGARRKCGARGLFDDEVDAILLFDPITGAVSRRFRASSSTRRATT